MTRFWPPVYLRLASTTAGSVLFVMALTVSPAAQQAPMPGDPPRAASSADPSVAQIVVPADYVIGPEDVLTVHFRFDPDLSGDVTVRPDGKISLPIVKDVVAAGLTIEQLRAKLNTEAAVYIKTDPAVTVQAKVIRSRKVYITGMVGKQGAYDLLGPMDVLTLITLAGGVQDFANDENIVIIRTENGRQTVRKFNYEQVKKGERLEQNIELKPGDKVIVPD